MTPEEARGARLGLVRRLVAAFEGKDLPVPAFAARLGKDKKQVYRYERGEDKPKERTVDKIVQMCIAAGLPMITAEWIERGRGGAAALGELRVPDSALAPTTEAEPVEIEIMPEAPLPVSRPTDREKARPKKTRAQGLLRR